MQVEHDLASKWLVINSETYQEEVNKYKNLKRSLSKRSEKQAEIRDNTAMMLNSGFHTYAYLFPAHTVSWEGPCAHSYPVLHVMISTGMIAMLTMLCKCITGFLLCSHACV